MRVYTSAAVSAPICGTGGISDNGRITVRSGCAARQRSASASTPAWSTSKKIGVKSVQGTSEANSLWTITVIDGTHIDPQGSSFANLYTSCGYGSDASQSFPEVAITLDLGDIGNIQFIMTGIYPDLGRMMITYPGPINPTTGSIVVRSRQGYHGLH